MNRAVIGNGSSGTVVATSASPFSILARRFRVGSSELLGSRFVISLCRLFVARIATGTTRRRPKSIEEPVPVAAGKEVGP